MPGMVCYFRVVRQGLTDRYLSRDLREEKELPFRYLVEGHPRQREQSVPNS